MFPYWLLFSIFAFGTLQNQRRPGAQTHRGPHFLVAGLFVLIMIGLRYRVGGDWGSYSRIFERITYMDLGSALAIGDPGYAFLNWLSHWLGYDIWFVNLICAIIFTWGLVRFAQRQPDPWLALLVAVPYLIIVVAMGYTRQAVAIGIVLAGLAVLDRSSVLRFAVYVFFAVMFHKSAIVVLPIVALSAAKNRLLIAALLLFLMACLYYIFVAGSIDSLVTNYIEAQFESQGALIRCAMNLPPALLYLRFQNEFGLTPVQQKLWRNFSLAALFTLAALTISSATTAIDRLALYLIPLQVFVFSRLPEVLRGTGRRNSQILLAIMGYYAVIQFVWLNYANNAIYWVPYHFYPSATGYEDYIE